MGENTILSLVVAIAENGVIGAKGGMPWKLSSDLKRFKRDTMGKPIVMGRKTFESIGKPLPGRANIVITRQQDFTIEGCDVVGSLDAAIEIANTKINDGGLENEICIIGGGELYKQALAQADRLYVTHVLAAPAGDTYFPEILPAEWEPIMQENIPAGEKDSAKTIYAVYNRIKSASKTG